MDNKTYYYNPLQKKSNKLHLNFSYDPAIVQRWKPIRLRQTLFIFTFPVLAIVSISLFYKYGSVVFVYDRPIDLKTLAFGTAISNVFLLPITIVNFRCPRCGLYVGGSQPSWAKKLLSHFFPNLFVRSCPHCQATLR